MTREPPLADPAELTILAAQGLRAWSCAFVKHLEVYANRAALRRSARDDDTATERCTYVPDLFRPNRPVACRSGEGVALSPPWIGVDARPPRKEPTYQYVAAARPFNVKLAATQQTKLNAVAAKPRGRRLAKADSGRLL
jgi:hypothetical protein